jgi:hypothetical protein
MWKKLKSLVARSTRSKFVGEDLAEVLDHKNDHHSRSQTSDAPGVIENDDDLYKILEIKRDQPIDRSTVTYNVTNHFEFLSVLRIANSLYEQKSAGEMIAKYVNYRGVGGAEDGRILLQELKRVVINFDSDIVLIEPYTRTIKYRVKLGFGLKLYIRGNDRNLFGNRKFQGLFISAGSYVVIERLNISRCGSHKQSQGGGIYNNGVLKLRKVFFSECQGKVGGAIFNDSNGEVLMGESTALLCKCFLDGAVCYNRGYMWVRDVLFKNNSAEERAGVIFNDSKSTFEIDAGIFERNQAKIGGALWNHRDSMVIFGMHKMYDNVARAGNIFGHNSFEDGELKDKDISSITEKIQVDPSAGNVEISTMHNTHVNADGLLYARERLPLEVKSWPIWTSRNPCF